MVNFNTLYELVRTAAGDFAGTGYPDLHCRRAISLSLLSMSDYEEVIVGANHFVDPDIEGDDMFELVCRAALCLLQPEDPFSYRTAVLSVTRKGTAWQARIDWLEQMIMQLEGDGIPMAKDGSLEYYLQSAELFEQFINEYST